MSGGRYLIAQIKLFQAHKYYQVCDPVYTKLHRDSAVLSRKTHCQKNQTIPLVTQTSYSSLHLLKFDDCTRISIRAWVFFVTGKPNFLFCWKSYKVECCSFVDNDRLLRKFSRLARRGLVVRKRLSIVLTLFPTVFPSESIYSRYNFGFRGCNSS